ncbi:response regulator transcription factor [Lagierella sp.]|uniref:response regulator transcription factor n=1 Tax=Lagierella sp. TaxID=2849657 RepID=UPI002639E002|nr:response regulator transcription factor [Lagierella sp.]
MASILIIEDDFTISNQLSFFLEEKGFKTSIVNNYSEALELSKEDFDLALLDINLPDREGTNLIKVLKAKSIRVIVTTVKNKEDFIVKALDLGADDYLTKPFNLSILRARIDACLRTRTVELDNKISYGNCVMDLTKAVAYYNGEVVDLTALEFEVLKLFIENPNRIFTREQLLRTFWENRNQFVNDNTLTATIKRIRNKTSKNLISTVRGIGYRME